LVKVSFHDLAICIIFSCYPMFNGLRGNLGF
jgi:hypothetical protein